MAQPMLLGVVERNHARWRTAMTEAITRILVPVDFSAHSEKAVRYATTLASRLGARVSLLHVVEDPFVTGAWRAEAFVPNMPELLDELIRVAQAQISELKTRLASQGVVVETAVITGQPARSIVEHASTGGFDLIVMGTHGRTGLSHTLVGSIAERVVQRAPCAVLTVRETNPAVLKHAAA
jgi:nucleotide-binding universal stress UspA family protein